MTSLSALRVASTDFKNGARDSRLWIQFARHDIVARYRRSWIGPIWLILTAIVFIAALGGVYGTIFRIDIKEYVPFVAVGIAAWTFISGIGTEGPFTFVEAENYIRQVRVNLFVYVFRVLCRNVLVFAHQFLIVIILLLALGKLQLHSIPFITLGVILLFAQGLWLTLLAGIVGTRYRDLQPLIANALQLLFFVTPIIWNPALLGERHWIADFNPLHSVIAVFREPLLGEMPSLMNYSIVLAMTAVGSLGAALLYGRFKDRIVYWL